MNQPSLRLSGISHRFGARDVLVDLDLDLAGGVVGLLGPNGAGKTTLLRILATTLAPTDGRCRLLGLDPADPDQRRDIRRRLGYLPQDGGYPRGFTAFRYVDYIAALKEWSDRDARHAEVRRVLGLVGMEASAARAMRRLSGGQQRRVAIAQALLGDPDLLVLDEPTTGLDPEQRASLRGVLSQAGRGATVVIATHQTEDVAALCERVVVLDEGRVQYDGPVAGLVDTARGKVWHADREQPGTLSTWRTGSGAVRHVDPAPPSGAALVEPTLEDAYLLLRGLSALEKDSAR